MSRIDWEDRPFVLILQCQPHIYALYRGLSTPAKLWPMVPIWSEVCRLRRLVKFTWDYPSSVPFERCVLRGKTSHRTIYQFERLWRQQNLMRQSYTFHLQPPLTRLLRLLKMKLGSLYVLRRVFLKQMKSVYVPVRLCHEVV